jgi:large subunit ribosomal protein L17
MRHRKSGRKFSRTSAHRRAMFRNLATELFRHERIVTTDEKAKELRGIAERLITIAKRAGTIRAKDGESAAEREKRVSANKVHAHRRAAEWVRDKEVLKKLFDDFASRFADRPGGYSRIVKWKQRPGDAAPVSIIELIPGEGTSEPMAAGDGASGAGAGATA